MPAEVRTDPPVSERQRRAMWAAAEGNSKLGIPQSVGREFVKGDAAGAPEGGDLTDYEAAEAVRDGELPSPTKYGDFWLFDLRVTGTGMAWRDRIGEWAYRDPEVWATEEVVKRSNGLPVIWDHPPDGGLNHEEYQERSIGSIMLPYIKGEEVWGVAKIFDEHAALAMQTTHRSTSPGVTTAKGATPISLEGGAKVLDEGLPLILDHLAVCEAGVWDKDGPPTGVRLDSLANTTERVPTVADKSREEELQEQLDSAIAERDSHKSRADAAEGERDDARSKLDEKEKADAKRKDEEAAEAKEREEKDAREKADAKRKDARKKHHDAKKHDGDYMDCSRCDSEKEEIEKGEEGAREDATANVNANIEKELSDAKIRADSQQKIIDAQAADIAALKRATQPLSMDDKAEIAKAFHRADSIYPALGHATPEAVPGETPRAYRARLAHGIREHTQKFKDYRISDSLDTHAFDLIENSIYAEAIESARNPVVTDASTPGRLIEIKSTGLGGKPVSEFIGDARTAWLPFMPPRRNFITKFNNAPAGR